MRTFRLKEPERFQQPSLKPYDIVVDVPAEEVAMFIDTLATKTFTFRQKHNIPLDSGMGSVPNMYKVVNRMKSVKKAIREYCKTDPIRADHEKNHNKASTNGVSWMVNTITVELVRQLHDEVVERIVASNA